MTPHTAHTLRAALTAVAATCTGLLVQAQAQVQPLREQLHANAVASFQQGRFPEAFGRFVALANAGHAPAAELALFMAQHDLALFGRDWDVTQDELSAWAALSHRPVPQLQPRLYPPAAANGLVAAR